MSTLSISLLGQFKICHSQQCLPRLPTANARLLLYYLLLFRNRCHSRQALAGLFWGEALEEQARANLRTSLWRLRALLGAEGIANRTFLIVDRDEIGFDTSSDYWLDVESFENDSATSDPNVALVEMDNEEAIARLTRAISLYRGDLLPGCYDDWCLRERERLKELYLRNLTRLMVLHGRRGDYDEAIGCGLRVLAYDPLMEEVQRSVMELHVVAGNRAAALRQYLTCRRVLAEELGVEPMEETTALYRRLLGADTPSPESRNDQPAWGEDSFAELRRIERELQALHRRLQQSLATIDPLNPRVDPIGRP